MSSYKSPNSKDISSRAKSGLTRANLASANRNVGSTSLSRNSLDLKKPSGVGLAKLKNNDGGGDASSGIRITPENAFSGSILKDKKEKTPFGLDKQQKSSSPAISTYFRGPDATGLFMPRPLSRSNRNSKHNLQLLDESEEFKINSAVLDKTSRHVFYSAKMTHKIASNMDKDDSLRLSSAGYHSDGEPEIPSPPLKNLQFKEPPAGIAAPAPRQSPRSRNYSSIYGEDSLTAEDEDEDSDSSTTDDDESSSESDEDSKSDKSSNDEDAVRRAYEKRKRAKALMAKELLKEEQHFQKLNNVKIAPSQNKKKVMKAESEENIPSNGFVEALQKRKSSLGNVLSDQLEALSLLKSDGKTPSVSSHQVLNVHDMLQNPPSSKPTKKNGPMQSKSKTKSSPDLSLNNIQDVTHIVDDLKQLHSDVMKIMPKNHDGRKYLMGNKSILTTSSSNVLKPSSTRRQHTNLSSTRSGLTIYPTASSGNLRSSLLDPIDEVLRQENPIKVCKTKSEIAMLKQKLGLGSKMAVQIESESIYRAAKLKLPNRTTRSTKLARDEYQARDAEMVAARRLATLAKQEQNKSRYILTAEELTLKTNIKRPSKLLKPTQGSIQRAETIKAEKVKSKLDPHNSRSSHGEMFKPSRSVHAIPKLATPAWRNI